MKASQIVSAILIIHFLLAAAGLGPSAAAQKSPLAPPYETNEPVSEPVLFGEGVISTGDYESHPAFTPDGRTLYFLKSTPNFNHWTIVVSRFEKGKWGEPETAPFSGQYNDADPFITPDGSKLYFISDRPVNGKAKKDLDVWMIERTSTGWGVPRNLGAPVNSSGEEWYPTLAMDGTLYFGSDRPGGKGKTDIYRAKLVKGKYSEPENLGDQINTANDEFEPYIAPDQSYLVFMALRPGGYGGYDLYLSYNRNGVWTRPTNLGETINSSRQELSPTVSPDGKYFFFTSTRGFADAPLGKRLTYSELLKRLRGPRNGLGDIYQVSIGALHVER